MSDVRIPDFLSVNVEIESVIHPFEDKIVFPIRRKGNLLPIMEQRIIDADEGETEREGIREIEVLDIVIAAVLHRGWHVDHVGQLFFHAKEIFFPWMRLKRPIPVQGNHSAAAFLDDRAVVIKRGVFFIKGDVMAAERHDADPCARKEFVFKAVEHMNMFTKKTKNNQEKR